jgi:putative ABC transport system ATP-binding protein
MIKFKEVSKFYYTGGNEQVKALDQINLEIPKGQYVVVVGANGSGKSTLLNALAGSVRIDKGSIEIENQVVSQSADYQRSKWIARIFQNPLSGTAPDLSVLDNFRLAALRTRAKTFKIGINHTFTHNVKEKIALLNMGLENKLGQAMGSLSGGQRQALTLIMAIMDEAKILLLDEPTAALDPKSAQNLMEKAQEIIQNFNLTAILVSHNLKDVHQYGHRLIQMNDGKIYRDLDAQQKSALTKAELYEWFE